MAEVREDSCLCHICGKCFLRSSNVNRHIRNVHNVDTYGDYSFSRLICPQDDCRESFLFDKQLRTHLLYEHEIEVICDTLEFDSDEDFQEWKLAMEDNTVAQYVKDTATKVLAGGVRKTYYNCSRSHKYMPKKKFSRALKAQGSKKIGKYCPSRIEVTTNTTLTEGQVLVKFWRTHCGHTCDLKHVSLDKMCRDEIAVKLHSGTSFDKVINDVRDCKEELPKRMKLLDRTDLYNILRDYNIPYASKYYLQDVLSVKLWTQEMEGLEEESPVLFIKHQEEDFTSFEPEDFVLVVMTTLQSTHVIKFGADKVCVDRSHCSNPHGIEMFTLLTVDEFGCGCPVSFCFSNRKDEFLLRFFFDKVKEKVGVIDSTVFMSDDEPAFYNAWSSVMIRPKHKVLCSWHVERCWKKKINKIKGGRKKNLLVGKTLRTLLGFAESKDSFHELLNQTVTNLLNDLDTKDFGEYFVRCYAARPECWARCYCSDLGISTNMHLESFHNTLKKHYLEGKKSKSLVTTIHAVLRLTRDCMFKGFIRLCELTPNERDILVNKSHQSSINISPDMIETLTFGCEWVVKSSDSMSGYVVSKYNDACSGVCLTCAFCNICIHSFKCSCNDNVIKMNICKHIHACSTLCFTYLLGDPVNMTNEVAETVEITTEELVCEVTSDQLLCNPDSVNEKLKQKASLVLDLVDKVNMNIDDAYVLDQTFDQFINLLNEKCQNVK